MATDYTYLYHVYASTISADQLYRICHISKRKAKWLLDHGIIPCQDSGRKTRRYKIQLDDVIAYLQNLESHPEAVATPVGEFTTKKGMRANGIYQIDIPKFQQYLYIKWSSESDALSLKDVRRLTGYSSGMIRHQMLQGELKSILLPIGERTVAKQWLVEFTAKYTVKNPNRLSDSHQKIVDQFLYANDEA